MLTDKAKESWDLPHELKGRKGKQKYGNGVRIREGGTYSTKILLML